MLLSIPLAAQEMSVKWEWTLDDPDVTAYRYQLGGENPDGWTVLPPDTSSLELTGLDAGVEYILYLQRTYDGRIWSPSAVSTAKADLDAIPEVRLYRYSGYELRAEIYTGSTVLYYPEGVTDADAVAFFAVENEKYGLAELGITFTLSGDGKATISYPLSYSREVVASELDALVNDLVDYVMTPPALRPEPVPVEESEPVVIDEPIVRTYTYAGYTLVGTISTGSAVLEYPAVATDSDVNTFFALENEKYGLAELGVSYVINGNGRVTVTYPEAISKEDAADALDAFVADLIAYLSPVSTEPEPVVEEEISQPATPAVPAVVSEDESAFDFSLLVHAGVLSSFDDSFKFDDRIFANVGLGFDFSNLVSAGDHFGLGLRSDLMLSFLPKSTGKWDLEDKLDYFNVFVYAEMVSLDLKLMAEFTAGPAVIYIGGGAGIAAGNPHNCTAISDYLTLGDFKIGDAKFLTDWFASATAGIRFRTSDVFSIGAEVNYRYMVDSGRHMGSADLILGFTF